MNGFYEEDEDCCHGCGVRMDVIGPPGPTHRLTCPVAIEERAKSAVSQERNRRMLSWFQGRLACGCVVSGESILDICLKPSCVLLQEEGSRRWTQP